MDSELEKFIKSDSRAIKYDDQGIVVIKYLGYEMTEGRFGRQVQLNVEDQRTGDAKVIMTKSKKLLDQIFIQCETKEGDILAIKKTGNGFETEYQVKKIPGAETAKPKEKEKEDEAPASPKEIQDYFK